MIEVLIAMVVIAIGLLGMAQLQARLQASDIDAYQRALALSVVEDISSRLAANRGAAAAYLVAPDSPLGVGMTCPTNLAARSGIDLHEWCRSLQGISEMEGSTRVGAMTGARGCIEQVADGEYLISVTWQGMGPVVAPPDSVACAQGLYDEAGDTQCENDLCRRFLTTVVRIADLD